jgi:hypothetical protein
MMVDLNPIICNQTYFSFIQSHGHRVPARVERERERERERGGERERELLRKCGFNQDNLLP